MVARAGVEPMTPRAKCVDSTNAPPTLHEKYETCTKSKVKFSRGEVLVESADTIDECYCFNLKNDVLGENDTMYKLSCYFEFKEKS